MLSIAVSGAPQYLCQRGHQIEGLTRERYYATFCSATMFGSRKPRKPLSGLEHLVMEIVWARGSATAEDVRSALAERHPMKESTVRTILTRLEAKGYVAHRTAGRTNIYTGVEAPQSVAANAVRQIIDRFCGGSVEQLLVGMVNDEVVDERELQRLAQRIARRKNREGE
jgi:BlaI family penicillinase repressor